jgi:hypothetical protein
MPRRREVPKREILPDPKFGNVELSKFMNVIMEGGKKAVAERIIYGALDFIEKKNPGKDPVEAFTMAINNVKPMVEVKSRRVGGANYQVPVEVRPCAPPGAVDALDQGSRPQARRKVHGPAPGQRADGSHRRPWRCHEEA